MPSTISLTFIGHSAWRITYKSYGILIDPFITGNPVVTVSADDLNPTHIILTHGHGDHLGDAIAIAKRTGAQVISTFECAGYAKANGCENTADMGIGGGRNFDFGRVKFTIAHHSSSAPDGTYLGNPAGVVLMMGGRNIYHAGDTGLFLDMKLIGELHPLDVALLPIGDNYTMGVDDAVKAVEFLNPKIAIPMHYNTFPVIAADPELFRSKLEAMGAKGIILNPGESYQLEAVV